MSSAVSPTQQVTTPNTPILVTPSTDIKSFNEHKRDDSSDDQRQQLNKQNKSYTRVSYVMMITIFIIHSSSRLFFLFHS